MSDFDLNLAKCLAHTVLYEVKQEFSPNGIVDDAVNGDPPPQTPGESTGDVMAAYVKYLPQLFQTTQPLLSPYAQASAQAQAASSPILSQLQTDLYRQNAPQLADISNQISAGNKMAASQSDLDVLNGPGQQLADKAVQIDRQTNPEFYSTREAGGKGIIDLLSGHLTGGEEEGISRSLARDNFSKGLGQAPTNLSTISNAMKFGDAARNRTLQGVTAASQFLPASRSGFDPLQTALGRPSINTGDSKFQGVTSNSDASNTANNFFNQIAGLQQTRMDLIGHPRGVDEKVNDAIGSINF